MDVRRVLFPIAFLIFLLYAACNAHTPGQPRTLKDFLFVLEVFAIPFVVFIYTVRLLPTGKALQGLDVRWD